MKTKILTVLSALFGLMFINSGLNKFFNYMPMPEEMPEAMMNDFNAFVEISWLMPLIAIAEIIGGILLIFPKMRALGGLIVFPVMVGILLTHIIVEPSGLIMAIVLWAILIWVLYEDRKKLEPLFK